MGHGTKRNRKQPQSGSDYHTHKYKMEKQHRVQLMMEADANMLMSQRLQGVK